MADLYDRADIYDLFDNEERFQAYKQHWERILKGKNIASLLDVSIGSGNVTLPLAELGVKLCGSDLSCSMLRNCAGKAKQKGIAIELKRSDFRNLSCWKGRKFDCVASTGNSLPHVENNDLLKALEQMDSLVKEGGWLYFDMRNWDEILRERNRFYPYAPMFDNDTRINVLQVWDYHDVMSKDVSMTFNLLYTFEKNNKIFRKETFEERYYPIERELLLEKLKKLGYSKIQLMCFPAFFEDLDVYKVEWYCVMGEKY